jgi:hypothetical protein
MENSSHVERVVLPFDGVCEIKSVSVREARLFGTILCVEMVTLSPVAGKTLTWALKLNNRSPLNPRVGPRVQESVRRFG